MQRFVCKMISALLAAACASVSLPSQVVTPQKAWEEYVRLSAKRDSITGLRGRLEQSAKQWHDSGASHTPTRARYESLRDSLIATVSPNVQSELRRQLLFNSMESFDSSTFSSARQTIEDFLESARVQVLKDARCVVDPRGLISTPVGASCGLTMAGLHRVDQRLASLPDSLSRVIAKRDSIRDVAIPPIWLTHVEFTQVKTELQTVVNQLRPILANLKLQNESIVVSNQKEILYRLGLVENAIAAMKPGKTPTCDTQARDTSLLATSYALAGVTSRGFGSVTSTVRMSRGFSAELSVLERPTDDAVRGGIGLGYSPSGFQRLTMFSGASGGHGGMGVALGALLELPQGLTIGVGYDTKSRVAVRLGGALLRSNRSRSTDRPSLGSTASACATPAARV